MARRRQTLIIHSPVKNSVVNVPIENVMLIGAQMTASTIGIVNSHNNEVLNAELPTRGQTAIIRTQQYLPNISNTLLLLLLKVSRSL